MNSCIMDKVNSNSQNNSNNLSNLKTNNNITSAMLSLWHVAALEIDKYDGSTLHTCCWTVSLDVINFNFHLLLITLYPLQHTLYLPLSSLYFPFNKLKCQKHWQCRIVSSAPRSAVWGASWAYENDCHRHFWHLANTIRQQLLLPGRQRDRQTDRETGRHGDRQTLSQDRLLWAKVCPAPAERDRMICFCSSVKWRFMGKSSAIYRKLTASCCCCICFLNCKLNWATTEDHFRQCQCQ